MSTPLKIKIIVGSTRANRFSEKPSQWIHELAKQVKVSTRTIRRDLQALQEAGFAVYDEGEENETKRWRLNAQPFKNVQEGLSVGDVAALYLSRSVVEGLSGWPLADELGQAFTKIERALNPRMREFLSTLPQVLSAKAGPRAGGPSRAMVDVTRKIFDAARERRVLHMRYFSAASNRERRSGSAKDSVAGATWVATMSRDRASCISVCARKIAAFQSASPATRSSPSRQTMASVSSPSSCSIGAPLAQST